MLYTLLIMSVKLNIILGNHCHALLFHQFDKHILVLYINIQFAYKFYIFDLLF